MDSRTATPTTATIYTRPTYKSPRIQALSDQRVCFLYSQKDYFTKDCPTAVKINEILKTQENNTELKKEEP